MAGEVGEQRMKARAGNLHAEQLERCTTPEPYFAFKKKKGVE